MLDIDALFNSSKLDEKDKALLVSSILSLVLLRFSDMIGDHLTEEETLSLENISDTEDPGQLLAWFSEHIPNFQQGIEEILAEERMDVANKLNALMSVAT